MTGQFDYYAIMGVSKNASEEEIQEAFLSLASKLPKAKRDPTGNPEYKRILNAYEVLSDKQRREIYDSLLVETNELSLSVRIQASREQIPLTDKVQLLYILADLIPPSQQKNNQQLPLNLSLVIDRSTSMKGKRLRSVKKAVDLIVEKMTGNDILSIISFSDRAEVVVPAEFVQNTMMISSKVRSILASGGTEIYQGLNAAYKEMIKHPLKNYNNHLILLTDGHTYGDSEQCIELAGKAAEMGIGFSGFGIGTEWNDQFLDQLVAPSGGQSGFIEMPEDVITYLQKRIQGLGQLFAKNVYLQNDFPKSMTLAQAFKMQPFAQPVETKGERINLGDVEERTPLSVLLEFNVEPQPIETRINLPLTFVGRVFDQNQERTFKQQHQIMVVSHPKTEQPPQDIISAVRNLSMHRMNEKVQEEVEAGNIDMATTRMRYLSTRLLQAGETDLAHQAHVEAERLENVGSLSEDGHKRIKYGTRALMNQTILMDKDD